MVENQALYNNLYNYENGFKELQKENKTIKKELEYLEKDYDTLQNKYNDLNNFIKDLFQQLKQFFRDILLLNDKNKSNKISNILKDCYEKDYYNSYDLNEISKNTNSETTIDNLIYKEELEKDYDYFE